MSHPRRWRWLAGAALLAVVAGGVLGFRAWNDRLPSEYRTLQSVLRRLAQGNDLGTQPIAFMVVSGPYAAELAQQRGLCKPDRCELFAQLNPYQHYGNGWDELNRQAYAIGDIQGWSVSSGTVMLTRSGFRAYGPHTDYLACTVAHEISHFRRSHVFVQSYHDSRLSKDLSDDDKQRASLKLARQQELEADRDAAIMLARAGYKGRVCQHELEFMHRSVGDGSTTMDDSTHPGYDERIAAMRAHYDSLEKTPPKPQPDTPGHYTFDPTDNLLTMTPRSSGS